MSDLPSDSANVAFLRADQRRRWQAGERVCVEEYLTDYPELARVARAGGFADVAEWFDSLAAAEAAHATQLRRLHGA